jgi:catechol 2,3-dioxygenase-like lactoylglutathione lyase family enzyme
MLDHFGMRVRNSDVSLPFYRACPAPLGINVIQEQPQYKAVIFMQEGSPVFLWLGEGEWTARAGAPRMHLGFRAKTPSAVDAFFDTALKMGGTDNGPPGYRRPACYSAFVIDPDGNNIEAVWPPERVA